EQDFIDLAAAGVTLIGEVGLGSVKTGADAAPMLAWARAHGFVSTFHTGGPSIAGSSAIRADVVLEARPDIVGHVNGGTTALPHADIEALVASGMAIEIVHCGNGRSALFAANLARELGVLDRVILGNDAPSGTGVVPLGILRLIAHLASLGGIDPAVAVCLATGNTARVHRLETGTIAIGREADLALVDAPIGSAADTALGALAIGDLPGVGMMLIDGKPVIGRSRNTPPAARTPEVVKGPGVGGGGH
ncbi:MAG: amidohydrolase family protein, partial [Candidatus Limnocylindrales bacterium]